MRISLAAVHRATGGRGPDSDPAAASELVVDGADFDSRTIQPGQLFVPVVGDRDGHDFVGAAIGRGALAYLSSRGPIDGIVAPCIAVDDTVAALQRLATLARGAIPGAVVGITGSVGKTSTKDFARAALGARWRTHANVGSFNNELGLPVTILGAPDGTEALVVEMGMRGFGQITELCEIAHPTIGVVTRVAAAHTELVGSIDGVERAKGELVEALPASGVAILNADDERVLRMSARTRARVLTYGAQGEVRIETVELDDLARPTVQVATPWGRATIRLSVSGEHQGHNAVGALAIALAADVALDAAAHALESVTISKWRMEVTRSAAGAVVINDAYNANPASMLAALDALAALRVPGRSVAFIGAMAELGDEHAAGHRNIAVHVRRLGIALVAVGTDDYGVPGIGLDDARAMLSSLGVGDAALIKASRAVGLERLVS
jgi:UDP-N-acetylmuramoyl-tripeptide--D-alanyl-D-alanine ligase